ncbi:MAG: methyl-accepting chemotaxis protein, partial [Usitatibacteraceae bacterium]
MDEVTQQNAALVEQAAAAAESLEEQAQVLAQAVGVFKVNATAQHIAHNLPERRDASTRPANVARLPPRRQEKPASALGIARMKSARGNVDWSEF